MYQQDQQIEEPAPVVQMVVLPRQCGRTLAREALARTSPADLDAMGPLAMPLRVLAAGSEERG